MTTLHQKHQILASLDAMDQTQMEKVLRYIKGIASHPSRERNYDQFRKQALKEIRLALRDKKGSIQI